MEYGNYIDKKLVENALTVTEMRDMQRYMKKLGILIKKCNFSDVVWIEYKFNEDGTIIAVGSFNDTDEMLKS